MLKTFVVSLNGLKGGYDIVCIFFDVQCIHNVDNFMIDQFSKIWAKEKTKF